MGLSKITRNFQVTVPRDVRELEGLRIGDQVLFAVEGKTVHFAKMDWKKSIEDVAGLWAGTKTKEGGVEYVKKIRRGWGRRLKRMGL